MIQQYATPPRFGTEPLPPGEYALICQECQHVFSSTDPDRKYCDQHLVERVNGAGILEDDDDDLFALPEQTCADCGQKFTSSRRAVRCALCASLRSGEVGAASVECPACGIQHGIPILSPTKLCGPCRIDPVMTLASCQARLSQARVAWLELDERLQADYAHADDALRTRFEAAVGLRLHGSIGDAHYTPAQIEAAWTKALAKPDLGPLLVLYDRAQAALAAHTHAVEAVRAVEETIDANA